VQAYIPTFLDKKLYKLIIGREPIDIKAVNTTNSNVKSLLENKVAATEIPNATNDIPRNNFRKELSVHLSG
jgi:hypothetical protein